MTDTPIPATGFAAVIDGAIRIDTVSTDVNMAITSALFALDRMDDFRGMCLVPDCDCFLAELARLAPEVIIVPVRVVAA